MTFVFLLPGVSSEEGFNGHPKGTILGIFHTGWEGEMPVFVGCTFPLESEFLLPPAKQPAWLDQIGRPPLILRVKYYWYSVTIHLNAEIGR